MKPTKVTFAWPSRVPQWLRNRYVLAFFAFGVYVAFFDQYSLVKQAELRGRLSDLEREREQFAQDIEEAEALREEIAADPERFARERYYMKRSDEDVYIIE